MLVIRMQRTGRAGHAMFRVVVQDSRRTPTSGKVVAALGSYDPHTKAVILDKDRAQFYLDHGAQPSGRVAYLLKEQGVKLPEWVTPPTKQERAVRNADKRRSTRPPEPAAETAPEAPAEAENAEPAPAEEKPEAAEAAETPAETEATAPADFEAEPTESEPAEAPAEEAPAETETSEPGSEDPAETAEPEAAAETPAKDAKTDE